MAIQKSDAIVLRRQDLRETSLTVTFYTRDFGKIRGVLRGVRGPRCQYAGGSLEVFARDEIVFYERKGGDYFTVSQCDLAEFFSPIRSSLEKLAHATYMAELLDSVSPLCDPNREVYDLFLNSLRLMAGEASAKRATRIFEIKLLNLLGLMPRLSSCASCGGKVDVSARFSLREGGLVCGTCAGKEKATVAMLAGTAKFIGHIMESPFEKVARIKVPLRSGRNLRVSCASSSTIISSAGFGR